MQRPEVAHASSRQPLLQHGHVRVPAAAEILRSRAALDPAVSQHQPGPLAFGQGDDPDAVNAHDLQTRMYDELYEKGGWTRTRLELKVARDPFNASTERQILVAIGVVAAFVTWRFSAHARPR